MGNYELEWGDDKTTYRGDHLNCQIICEFMIVIATKYSARGTWVPKL